MENKNELNEKAISYLEKGVMAGIDKRFEAGEEMARNTPAINTFIQKALEADKTTTDREKFVKGIIYKAFALGAVVQDFNETAEKVENMTEVYGIHETTDYKAFHILPGGRVPTEKRIDKLVASIKKVGFIPAPVIVNENMGIIDGACRVAACERLALPVYYIIQEAAGIGESIALNS